MPSAHKVGWAQLRVGLMAIAAMIILAVLVFLLTGSRNIFASTTVIYTFLEDSAALTKGAAVRLNGIPIGKVDDISLTNEKNPRRVIKLHLEVEEDRLNQIPVDSIAAISAENVLGTKYINIRKGKSDSTITGGAEIQSLDTSDFDEIFQQGVTLLAQLQAILKRIDAVVGLIESGKGSIGKLLVDEELYSRVLGIVSEFQKIAVAMNSTKGTLGKLINDDALYEDVRKSLGRMDGLMADLQEGKGTAGKFLKDDALYNEARNTIAEVRKTVEDLNAGKGTAGKLLKSEELHDQLRASLAKVDGMIDKINSGQGTIGQLLVNPQLYDSLTGVTGEMQQLVKDIRANPKKFLRIKLALF